MAGKHYSTEELQAIATMRGRGLSISVVANDCAVHRLASNVHFVLGAGSIQHGPRS